MDMAKVVDRLDMDKSHNEPNSQGLSGIQKRRVVVRQSHKRKKRETTVRRINSRIIFFISFP